MGRFALDCRPLGVETLIWAILSRQNAHSVGAAGTDFGPILADSGRFLVDFWLILVPKWFPKRFRRHARRSLLFDGVFDEGFDRCGALVCRTAVSRTSRAHCILPSQTQCRHVRRSPLRPNFFRKARSNYDSMLGAMWMKNRRKSIKNRSRIGPKSTFSTKLIDLGRLALDCRPLGALFRKIERSVSTECSIDVPGR